MFRIIFIFVFFFSVSFQPVSKQELFFLQSFKLGNELLLENIFAIKEKRIALISNQTGILPDGTHILDALIYRNLNVVKIFSPEHGIRGDEKYSGIDEKTGIPVISLYNEKKKPSIADLSDVEILIYDIQDVGARFYTYTSTLYYCIEAASENGKKIIVCDRPVILNPDYVDGFMLDDNFRSFVSMIPAPVSYGMTCGELALMIAGKEFKSEETVTVMKMDGYTRETDFNSLNLKWVKPSPSMFTSSTAVCYPATCFLEGTNVSEGRGTEKPFEYAGAPWCNGEILASELNSYNLSGVSFENIQFTPSEKISAYPPKYFQKECSGIYLRITDRFTFEPVKCGVVILCSFKKLFSEFRFSKDNFIDKLAGTDKLRRMITNGEEPKTITDSWKEEIEKFKLIRDQYILYH